LLDYVLNKKPFNLRNLVRHLLLFFILIASFPAVMSAQSEEAQEPSTLLPDINPQDIEIRGDFRARFPGISRQPILGFNPTPRIYRIDPNRMPFLETPEQVVASVPFSQLEAELGPPRMFTSHPESSSILGYTGFGMFVSPEAELYASVPLNEHTAVHSNLNFHSSDGHLTDEQGTNGAFRRADGSISINRKVNQTGLLGVQLRGRSDFSDMSRFQPRNNRTELHSGGVGLSWLNIKSAFDHTQLYASADYSQVNEIFNQNVMPITLPVVINEFEQSKEWAFNIGGVKSWAGNRIGHVFSIETDHQVGLYELDNSGKNWFVSSLSGYWKKDSSNGSRLTLGLRAFTGFDEISDMVVRAYPHVEYSLTTKNGLRIGGLLSGELRNHGHENAFITNRSLISSNLLANEQRVFSNLSAELDLGNLITLHGYAHASYSSRPRMFTAFGTFVHPKELLLLRPGAGVSFHISPGLLTLYSDAYVNFTRVDDTTVSRFENMEKFRLTAGLRANPADNLIIQTWLDILGSRHINEAAASNDNSDAGSALLLNIKAEYRVNGLIGIYIKGLNMLGQEYNRWSFYEERPLQVYGGITFKI